VPEFLSDAWLAALDDAARQVVLEPVLEPFVLEQVVTGVDARGTVTYHVVFATDGVRVSSGPAPTADVTLVTDVETAARLARGEGNAQQALASGRFRVRGDIETLVHRADGLNALDDAFRAVRAATTYR
jgi:hypothetical protein